MQKLCINLLSLLLLTIFLIQVNSACPVSYCSSCDATNTSCLVCTSPYVEKLGACYPCNWLFPNCASCTNSMFCSVCNMGAYFDANGVCLGCYQVIPNCDMCPPDYSVCQTCQSTAIWMGPSTCQLCSDFIDGCYTCTNQTICTGCISTNNTITLFNASCPFCGEIIDKCLNCTNNLTCIVCQSKYINLPNGSCQLCSVLMPYCQTCSSTSFCTLCFVSLTVTLWNGNCSLCRTPLNMCLECPNNATCTKCIDNYFLINFICLYCLDYLSFCRICIQPIVCLSCYIGKIVTGGCSSMIGCSKVQQNYSDHSSSCIECYLPDFYWNNITDKCECNFGHLAGQFCTEMPGCLVVNKNSTGQYCMVADTSNYFTINNRISQCMQYYYLPNLTSTVCLEICGDGFVFNLPCDDGNLISGDGCSASCQVQYNYICSGHYTYLPSSCVFRGKIEISNIIVKKIDNQNKGILTFQLSPKVPNLLKMDLKTYFSLQLPPNSSISKMQVINGSIVVQVDFLISLQGLDANATLSFDRQYIISPSTNKTFKIVSSNVALIYSDDLLQNKLLSDVCLGIGITAFVLFFFGSFAHKMIGVQTIMVFQLVFIFQAFAQRDNLTLTNLRFFKYAFGQSGGILSQVQITKQVILNKMSQSVSYYQNTFLLSILQYIVLFFIFLYTFILAKFRKSCKQKKQNSNYFKITFGTLLKICQNCIYDRLVFPIFIGFFFIEHISILIQSINGSYDFVLKESLKKISVIIPITISNILFFIEWRQFFYEPRNQQLARYGLSKSKYIPIFLTYSFLLYAAFAISLLYSSNNFFMAALVFLVTYLILLCAYRPYKHWIHNIAIIFNQIIIILSLIFAYIPSTSLRISKQDYFYAFCGLLAILSVVLLIAIIRIIIIIKLKCGKYNMKEESGQRSYKQKKRQMNQLLNDESDEIVKNLNNLSPYRLESQKLNQRISNLSYINRERQNNNMHRLNFDLSKMLKRSIKVDNDDN